MVIIIIIIIINVIIIDSALFKRKHLFIQTNAYTGYVLHKFCQIVTFK